MDGSKPFPRPLPALSEMNAHFWRDGGGEQLLVLRCQACKFWIHPYSARCPECRSPDVKPEAVSGRGEVVGFTVNHQPWLPGVAVPYVVAVVALEEQESLRLMTNMPRTPIEDVRVGLPVKVFFEPNGDLFVPLFEAA